MALAGSDLLRRLLSNGWCVMPPGLAIAPMDFLSTLGPLLLSHATRTYHYDLRPCDKDSAPPASMSAITGTDAQPMHTDGAYYHLPPHFIALQCLEPGEAECPTHVWALDLTRLRRDGPTNLTKPDWVSRGDGHAPFYCPILEAQRGTLRIRFDPLCMRPVHRASNTADEVRKALKSCCQQVEIEWERGSLLIIDNWRCLHARGEGASQARSRRLRRWMIGVNHGLVG